MGLGKTICTIAAAERLIAVDKVGGGIVIAPASLKYQWAAQIDRWTRGTANVLVVDGPPQERKIQYQLVAAGKVEYCIMNYEQVLNDWPLVKNLPRDFIVLDECFPESTLIDTPSGPRAIEDIHPGDPVLNVLGACAVTGVRRVYKTRLLRVVRDDGREIVCSLEHPLLTSSGWQPAVMIT